MHWNRYFNHKLFVVAKKKSLNNFAKDLGFFKNKLAIYILSLFFKFFRNSLFKYPFNIIKKQIVNYISIFRGFRKEIFLKKFLSKLTFFHKRLFNREIFSYLKSRSKDLDIKLVYEFFNKNFFVRRKFIVKWFKLFFLIFLKRLKKIT